jgi:hypothetical protein
MEFRLYFLLILPCLWKNSSNTTKENLMIWSKEYNNWLKCNRLGINYWTKHRTMIKKSFEKKVSKEYFQLEDIVLKWDAPKQDKGKHGKFEALWIGPFKIFEVFSNNTYKLQNVEDSKFYRGPINGKFLKNYFS